MPGSCYLGRREVLTLLVWLTRSWYQLLKSLLRIYVSYGEPCCGCVPVTIENMSVCRRSNQQSFETQSTNFIRVIERALK